MRTRRTLVGLMATMALLAACGDPDDPDASTVTDSTSTVPAPTTTAAPNSTSSEPATTVAATTTTEEPATTVPSTTAEPTTSVAPDTPDQLAIWPAADVVFATPEEAAEDFVLQLFGEGPELGDFVPGDARSGEMMLLSPGEGDNPVTADRGLILLRQLGPDDGWFVIGVANDEASITTPESGAAVPAAPLTVEGVGRGFEANLVARALVAGEADSELDIEITLAGTMEEPGPYAVELDLSGAEPGDVVMLLVNTGAGLETDPGEVGAIPVLITD